MVLRPEVCSNHIIEYLSGRSDPLPIGSVGSSHCPNDTRKETDDKCRESAALQKWNVAHDYLTEHDPSEIIALGIS